ncbi:MAG: sulfotransferase domain-containing protein, partial [Chloroflexota bacterium]
IANNPPIVLMIRHPLQVVSSWKKLGWGKESLGTRSDFDIITSQEALIEDFPVVGEVMQDIDRTDLIQNVVFQWCIYHLVPAKQLKKQDAYALYYENLIADADNEIAKLFNYLDKPFDKELLKSRMDKTSSTNFQKRNFSRDNTVNSWKGEFSPEQIETTNHIVSAFGLDDLYDSDGFPTGTPLLK